MKQKTKKNAIAGSDWKKKKIEKFLGALKFVNFIL